ncbi:hypothetical protein T484DRAFT_1836228 [Baffinella frigidus]|nr:hypothetical protein T484DRAFT_1836228 [Cryptophyta sp. CCMP2293]
MSRKMPRLNKIACGGLLCTFAGLLLLTALQPAPRTELSSDSFIDSFLRKSKSSVFARRGKAKAFHNQVEKGGLFARMHALERHDKAAKKAWRNKALESITEPSSKGMIAELEAVQTRATGGSSFKSAVNNLEHNADRETGRASDRRQARGGYHHAARHHAARRHSSRAAVPDAEPTEIPQVRLCDEQCCVPPEG